MIPNPKISHGLAASYWASRPPLAVLPLWLLILTWTSPPFALLVFEFEFEFPPFEDELLVEDVVLLEVDLGVVAGVVCAGSSKGVAYHVISL